MATTLPEIPEQEEVSHVSKDVHARVHPGTAQPLAAHGEDASHGVADAARSVARQEPMKSKQGGFDQQAPRRLLAAPGQAPGHPKLRPASANQPLGAA